VLLLPRRARKSHKPSDVKLQPLQCIIVTKQSTNLTIMINDHNCNTLLQVQDPGRERGQLPAEGLEDEHGPDGDSDGTEGRLRRAGDGGGTGN
jgi:hypothetical protein